jgi:lipopolysaccharide export system permease protein
LLYRYILAEVLAPFFGAVLFFIFVMMMFQVIKLAEFLVVHNVAIGLILELMGFLALSFLPIVIPISFLLAVLVGFGRLSADSEIIAMKSTGLSLYRLVAPIVGAGVVICIFSLLLNLYFVPWSNRMFRYELFRISNTKAIATIHEGRFTEGFFEMVLFADKVNSKDNTLEKVFIFDGKENQRPVSVIAKQGKIINDQRDEEGVPGLILRLFDGTLHRNNPASELYEYVEFSTYDIFLRLSTSQVVGVEKPRTLDFSVLTRRIDLMKAKENKEREDFRELNRLRVEFWARFALSFSCIIFAVLGVGFGTVRTRTVRSNSVMICLLVMLGYWTLHSAGMRWGEEGYVPPVVAMWAANLILAIISIFALRKSAR